jgi:hypothetical protein
MRLARLGVRDRGTYQLGEVGQPTLRAGRERVAEGCDRDSPPQRAVDDDRATTAERIPSAWARSATLPAICEKSSIRCGRGSRSTRAITESPSSVSRVPTRTRGRCSAPDRDRGHGSVALVAPQCRVHVAEGPCHLVGDVREHRLQRGLLRD